MEDQDEREIRTMRELAEFAYGDCSWPVAVAAAVLAAEARAEDARGAGWDCCEMFRMPDGTEVHWTVVGFAAEAIEDVGVRVDRQSVALGIAQQFYRAVGLKAVARLRIEGVDERWRAWVSDHVLIGDGGRR